MVELQSFFIFNFFIVSISKWHVSAEPRRWRYPFKVSSSQLHLLQQWVTNTAPLCRLHSLSLHSSVSLSGSRCFIFIFVHASFCLLQQRLCLIFYFYNSLHPVSFLISAQFSIQVLPLSSPFHLFCLQSSFDLLQILSVLFSRWCCFCSFQTIHNSVHPVCSVLFAACLVIQ